MVTCTVLHTVGNAHPSREETEGEGKQVQGLGWACTMPGLCLRLLCWFVTTVLCVAARTVYHAVKARELLLAGLP